MYTAENTTHMTAMIRNHMTIVAAGTSLTFRKKYGPSSTPAALSPSAIKPYRSHAAAGTKTIRFSITALFMVKINSPTEKTGPRKWLMGATSERK